MDQKWSILIRFCIFQMFSSKIKIFFDLFQNFPLKLDFLNLFCGDDVKFNGKFRSQIVD